MVLCLVGLVVLLQLHAARAQVVALASLALVAAYPFMKRITWWPQAWLGLVFTWAALVGWTEVARRALDVAALLLYAGAIVWVIGYDTIYALQDRRGRCADRGALLGAAAGRACAGRAWRCSTPLALALWAGGVLAGAARSAGAASRCCRWRCISPGRSATLDPDDGAQRARAVPVEPLRRAADVPGLLRGWHDV